MKADERAKLRTGSNISTTLGGSVVISGERSWRFYTSY